MLYSIFRAIGTAFISLGLFFGAHQATAPSFGATSATPIQTSPTNLSGAGITSTATSINLTSFVLPDPNKTPVQMSMLGSIGYAVLEPQSSKVENISFTGITQNSNGSAVLTGVSRGLSFYAPYAASTTLAIAHAGGAQLILSNSAAFYGQQFAFINNPETISGVWTFASTSPPAYDFNPNFNVLASTTLASIGYVASTSYAGVVNATTAVKGIAQLATSLQAASSTATGSTGAFLDLPASLATDTPNTNTKGSKIVMSSILGFINQGWLDLTANWNFTGNVSVGVNNAQGGFSPAGTIEAYASTTPPTGWLLANGQSVSTATAPNLFAVIGYLYGGSAGTFKVPNLAGSMVIMASTTNGINSTLGATGGATTTAIAQVNIPNYNLTGTAGNSGGGSSVLAAGGSIGSYSINSGGSNVPLNVTNPYFVLEYIIKE